GSSGSPCMGPPRGQRVRHRASPNRTTSSTCSCRRPSLEGEFMLLATDLDGTLLAGDPESRQRHYQLASTHPGIRLVFATGRGLDGVLPVLAAALVRLADFIVRDVGGRLVHGPTEQQVQPLQSDIDARWPGERDVAEAMTQFEG